MKIIKKYWRIKLFVVLSISFYWFNTVISVQGESYINYFNGTSVDNSVVLEWETIFEPDLDGFFILRSNQSSGSFSRLSNFIYSQGSEDSGLVYQYIDSNVLNGQLYFYKLEIIHSNNDSETFGLISVLYNQTIPTTNTSITTLPPTLSSTSTITVSPSISFTPSLTSSITPTSPFSFVTNTRTPSPTITPIITRTLTETPDLTSSSTYQVSRTFEIIRYGQTTPTQIIDISRSNPFQKGLIGFGISFFIGVIMLTLLVFLQKKSP